MWRISMGKVKINTGLFFNFTIVGEFFTMVNRDGLKLWSQLFS